MLKTIGLLLGVLAIWTTVEVYVKGSHGAFGGALSSWLEGSRPASGADRLSAPKRAEAAVERAHQQQQDRYQDLLGE